jgi:uncharacterized membrane protein HdeD (DUF308 family)
MSQAPGMRVRDPLHHGLAELRGNWGWFMALGVATIVLGMLVIGTPWAGTFAVVWMLSIWLIIAGIAQFVGAFWARRWSGFFLTLLAGILYVAIGILIFDKPVTAAATLTIVIAAFLLVGGAARIVLSFMYRFDGWFWIFLNGAITFLLGLLIWRQWPSDSLWVIGLFVGIEMVFNGWAWVMLALGVRGLPRA